MYMYNSDVNACFKCQEFVLMTALGPEGWKIYNRQLINFIFLVVLNELKINLFTDFVSTFLYLNWAICSLNTYQNVIWAAYMLLLFLGLDLVPYGVQIYNKFLSAVVRIMMLFDPLIFIITGFSAGINQLFSFCLSIFYNIETTTWKLISSQTWA